MRESKPWHGRRCKTQQQTLHFAKCPGCHGATPDPPRRFLAVIPAARQASWPNCPKNGVQLVLCIPLAYADHSPLVCCAAFKGSLTCRCRRSHTGRLDFEAADLEGV